MTWLRVFILFVVPLAGAQTVTVALRGGEPPLSGTLSRADHEGVVVVAGGVVSIIGWDRVAGVGGEVGDLTAELALGEALWRARIRVEKGDYAGAEPILDDLAPRFAGKAGPTAAAAARAVLECRLSRGASSQAVPAMLALAAAEVGGRTNWWEPTKFREPRPDQISPALVWDSEYGLSPLVPPMWVDTAATRSLARSSRPPGDGRASVLAALYEAGAAFECGLDAVLPNEAAGDAGTRLVYDVVASRVGDADVRRAARSALEARLRPEAPSWVVGWCRAALGRSLLLEPDRDSRMLGVAELLRVPATQASLNPSLTALCLAQAAAAMDDLGETAAADLLKHELSVKYPTHPVRSWERLMRRNAASAAEIAPAAGDGTRTGGPG